MTELRKRMIECLQLRGLSERTQEAYVRAVRQLADHCHKSPDLISEEELGQYFLHIKNVKKYSRAASTIAICGIKFFYEKTLNREFTTLKLVRAPSEKKLPVILSVEEVQTILRQVRLPRYRVCLSTIYSCGLRLQEGTHIQVRDIDSGRGMLHVRHGKGGKDRYVPLPERTVELLREYWVTHRNPAWMFPSEGRVHVDLKSSTEPIYHPHVHYIVTGGGLSEKGEWKRSREDFLVPVRALSVIFRAKFRDLLKKTELFDQVDPRVWKKEWVVHSEPVGSGEAAFKYLAPYVFRVAISNSRIVKLEAGRVTFKYKDSATDQVRFCPLTAEELMRRFLQHVLPERFVKVRYYGLLSPGKRHLLKRVREALGARTSGSVASSEYGTSNQRETLRCPSCGNEMKLIGALSGRGREPP